MLAIKLKRTGKKHQAHFRVVVAEKKSKMTGRSVDDIGWYNPHSKEHKINAEKAILWIKNGAVPTDSTHNLLVKTGIIKKAKIPVHGTKKEPKTS